MSTIDNLENFDVICSSKFYFENTIAGFKRSIKKEIAAMSDGERDQLEYFFDCKRLEIKTQQQKINLYKESLMRKYSQ